MRVIAVVPAYQEEGRIGAVVRALQPQVGAVIVVDDGSRDRTAGEAAAAGAIVVRLPINRGQGASLKTGNLAALSLGADLIVHFDADGQHESAAVPKLVAPLRAGEADVVYGSRFLGIKSVGMPWARRWLLKAARLFSVVALGVPAGFTDPQSGLRAMTADAVRTLDFRQDREAHCSELLMLLAKSDLRWSEVPVQVTYTAATLAKGNHTAHALKIVWQLLIGALG